jgi:hypothetical protein
LNPTSTVTIAPRGKVGTTGAAAGVVPWVITSGSYTDNAPVRGFRIVAWTNAPRFAKLAIVQPEACGVIPPVPVSCHGVDRPVALSGLAGTTMLQFTLAATTGAVVVAVGHGVAEAVAVVLAVAVAVGAAVVVAVGAAVAAAVGAAVVPVLTVGAAVLVVPVPVVVAGTAVVPAPVVVPVLAVLVGMAVLVAATLGVAVAAGLVVVVPTVDDVAGEDERQALATFAVLIAVPECEG